MVSLVIAAYNEERRLLRTLEEVRRYFHGRNVAHETVLVDDGSNDSTFSLAKLFTESDPTLRIIRYETNRGKGFALRTGVLASRGDVVVVSDADLSTPLEEIDRLLPGLAGDGAPVVYGSRSLPGSRIEIPQPWWRQGMGRVFNLCVRSLVIDGFVDTQCGFKLFRGDVGRELFAALRTERFAFDVELLVLAAERGYGVREVPVLWRNSAESKVHPVRDSLRMLKDLWQIRQRHRTGNREETVVVPAVEVVFGGAYGNDREKASSGGFDLRGAVEPRAGATAALRGTGRKQSGRPWLHLGGAAGGIPAASSPRPPDP